MNIIGNNQRIHLLDGDLVTLKIEYKVYYLKYCIVQAQ